MGESFSEVSNKRLHAEKKNLQSDWLEDQDQVNSIPQPIPRKATGIDPEYKPEVGRSPSRYLESQITSGKQFVDDMKAEERSAMNENAEDYQAASLMINGFFNLARRYGGARTGLPLNYGSQAYDQSMRGQPVYREPIYGQSIYGQQNYWQNNIPARKDLTGQTDMCPD